MLPVPYPEQINNSLPTWATHTDAHPKTQNSGSTSHLSQNISLHQQSQVIDIKMFYSGVQKKKEGYAHVRHTFKKIKNAFHNKGTHKDTVF